jgi:hypothetical protein
MPRPDGLSEAIENSMAEVFEAKQCAILAKPESGSIHCKATRNGAVRAARPAGGQINRQQVAGPIA